MKDSEWLLEAMEDDNMVAELLLHLKQSDPHPSALTRHPPALVASLPPMDWGVRLPRSKAAAPLTAKKDREPARRSPTTPLSWSACGVGSGGVGGGASPSDGYEDSSRPPDRFVSAVRSKGTAAANETTTSAAATAATKRQRRKKTFAELKEEESSLLKERSLLKRELDSIRVTLKEQRSLNEKLKRIKLDLDVQSGLRPVATLNQLERHEDQNNRSELEASTSTAAPRNPLKSSKREETSDHEHSCQLQDKPNFVLPDLNMIPEEDSTPGRTEGMS